MQALIGILFCVLLGVMVKVQGWFASLAATRLLHRLVATAQIALPINGNACPARFASYPEARCGLGVYARLLAKPILWLVAVSGMLFLVGFFWPSLAARVEGNDAFNIGTWLGIFAILLSPLSSKKSRSDFREDFDRSYGQFYTSSSG